MTEEPERHSEITEYGIEFALRHKDDRGYKVATPPPRAVDDLMGSILGLGVLLGVEHPLDVITAMGASLLVVDPRNYTIAQAKIREALDNA